MFVKTIIMLSVLSTSLAIIINTREELTKPIKGWKQQSYYTKPYKWNRYENRYPQYEYEYLVSDKKSGDHKHHFEQRHGDRVRGEYSLVEPGGSIRRVIYNADDNNGFNAIVSRVINKHSNDAYSVFDFSRQYHPMAGQGIKNNQFFPETNHAYQEMNTKRKTFKPVHEERENINHKINITNNIQSNVAAMFESIKNNVDFERSETSKVNAFDLKKLCSDDVKSINKEELSEVDKTKNNMAVTLPIEMMTSTNYESKNSQESSLMTIPVAKDENGNGKTNSMQTDTDTASTTYRRKIYYYVY